MTGTKPLQARELGFASAGISGIAGVSDRSYVADLLFGAAELCGVLSTIAADLLLWSTPGLELVSLGADGMTGSVTNSAKRNPTHLTDTRCAYGRVIGLLNQWMLIRHGLQARDLPAQRCAARLGSATRSARLVGKLCLLITGSELLVMAINTPVMAD